MRKNESVFRLALARHLVVAVMVRLFAKRRKHDRSA